MAIPFQLPGIRDAAEDYQNLDKLLGDLFAVLARILAQRGEPVRPQTLGAVTINRSTHQLRLQARGSVSDESNTDEELEVLDLSAEESAFYVDSEASSAASSPTSTSAPVSLSGDLSAAMPDLVSNLPISRIPTPRSRKGRSTPRCARSPRNARAKRSSNTSAKSTDVSRPTASRASRTTVC